MNSSSFRQIAARVILATFQKRSFNANWFCRGAFDCDEITPNDVDATLVFGPEKIGVLVALKDSARNSTRSFSVTVKILKSDTSKFLSPGFLTSGRVLLTFPSVNAAGCLNTDVLKYMFSLSSTRPSSAALWPLLLGRSPGPNMFATV